MIFKSAFNPSAAIGGGLAVVMLQELNEHFRTKQVLVLKL